MEIVVIAVVILAVFIKNSLYCCMPDGDIWGVGSGSSVDICGGGSSLAYQHHNH